MAGEGFTAPEPLSPNRRARLGWELAIVLALSFGASGVYAVVRIIERVTRETALSSQTATINQPLAERPGFDLTFQLLGFVFGLAPVALVVWLTWRDRKPHLGALGFSGGGRRRWFFDSGGGVLLAATIGIPGLAFYVVMKSLGLNTTVIPTALDAYWWTIPVLILQALRAAVSEEVIVVAYLFNRLKLLGVGSWGVITVSAILRGSYHFYQGFGGFIGNVIMGFVFGWAYLRWGRVMPLIIAHWILDIVSFVGFPVAVAWWPTLFS